MAQQATPQHDTFTGFLVRIYWLVFGNAALILLALGMAMAASHSRFVLFACLHGANALGLVVARYADIRFLGGRTADGDPATMGHWRRYLLTVVTAAVVVAAPGIAIQVLK